MKNRLMALLVGTFLTLGFATGVSADEHEEDRDCGYFDTTEEAVEFFETYGYDADNDPHRLDRDADGIPCEGNEGEETDPVTEEPVEEEETEEPVTEDETTSEDTEDAVTNDRDCDYFASHEEALTFWFTNGYSADNDPHRLDGDDDGIPCEVTEDEYNAFVDAWNDEEEGNEEGEATDEDEAVADEDEEEGEPLPDTATNNPLMMLFGAAIAGAGSLLMFRRREGKTQA